MASEKQIAANRRNALNSTGPRSAEGKKRSSANAYRHGLSVSLALLPEGPSEIAALAKVLRQGLDGFVSEHNAVDLAQGHLDVRRIRRVKTAVISTAYATHLRSKRNTSSGLAKEPQELVAKSIIKGLPSLRKLDRYERRAIAQCDRALRRIIGK